jgi:lambda repressor-like predicted transcriptional regulator
MLVEGNSMRAISRMADVSINTVTKLLVDVGAACADYQNATLRNLPCKRIQCDEIWGFCYAKERTKNQVARCGGGTAGSVAGGLIGYSIEKDSDANCVRDFEAKGFKRSP